MPGETINGNSGSEDASVSNPWEEQVSGNPDDSAPNPFSKDERVKDPEKARWMATASEASRRRQRYYEDQALHYTGPNLSRPEELKFRAAKAERERGQREEEAGKAYDAFSKYGGEPWAHEILEKTTPEKEEYVETIKEARSALERGEIDRGKSLAMEAAFKKTLYLIECGLMILKQVKKDEVLKLLVEIENE